MNGKIVVGFIVIVALLVGAGVYWAQVYAYYTRLSPDSPDAQITLVPIATQKPETIPTKDLQAIDASSSPLRYRACFTTPLSQAMLSETYVPAPDPVPLTGPGWFSCYDAEAIGKALEDGEALAFLAKHDIHHGVDRVVAVFADGRAYAWQQLNDEVK